jgi:hypothetical protein
MPLALTDKQFENVMAAAKGLSIEKRGVFLERVAGRLRVFGQHFSDAELDQAMRMALRGLLQSPAA